MKSHIALAALIAAVAQPVFAEDDAYRNNIDASFVNMLNHEPYAGPTQTTVALDRIDPVAAMLYAMVRETGRDGSERVAFVGDEGSGAGFARMLSHTAYGGPTGVTAPRTLDHRVDRLVFALRNMPRETMRLAANGR